MHTYHHATSPHPPYPLPYAIPIGELHGQIQQDPQGQDLPDPCVDEDDGYAVCTFPLWFINGLIIE